MKNTESFRKSENREPCGRCVHDEFCGGCAYQGMDYEKQLALKEKEVLRLFAEREITPERVAPIEGCPQRYGYRNKMEYSFGDFVKGGEMTLGMHRKGNFMSVATVDKCQLVDDDFNRILSFTLDFAQKSGRTFYHKKTHEGLLRNLVLRRGVRTGQLLVNIVTTSEDGFDEEAYAAGLLALPLASEIVGILRTFNDAKADAVICERMKVLWGRDYYEEKLLGLDFKVSAFSFFQTNVEAAERLYSEAVGLIDGLEGKTVFDLYCGTGTISQLMALRAAQVTGVELVAEAVSAAEENAALNDLKNCRFIAGDVFEVMESLTEKPDVIVVDPPRTGIGPKALAKIADYGVRQIVYVSCNPKTLAENVKSFGYYGYECRYLKPFDNFPFTKHTETVCLLSKLNVEHHIEVELTMDEMDLTAAEKKASYEEIKAYVLEKFGMKVSHLYIAQVKRKCGIIERENYNKPKSEDSRQPKCPPEKEAAIRAALEYFKMI